MKRFFIQATALMMVLALGLTAETMAMARGANAAVDEIILCTGHGPVAVHVDADGNPTTAPHICPDCALFFVSLNTDAPALRHGAVLENAIYIVDAAPDRSALRTPRATARSPPVTV